MCEAFGCTPDVAAAQDMTLVMAVLNYRAAVQARDVFNGPDKAKAFDQLKRQPHLMEVLAKMQRAQEGRPLSGGSLAEEGMAVADAHRVPPEEDEDRLPSAG